jgi:hypothetical protein
MVKSLGSDIVAADVLSRPEALGMKYNDSTGGPERVMAGTLIEKQLKSDYYRRSIKVNGGRTTVLLHLSKTRLNERLGGLKKDDNGETGATVPEVTFDGSKIERMMKAWAGMPCAIRDAPTALRARITVC